MITKGANIQDTTNSPTLTALMLASDSYGDSLAITKLLVKHGVEVNAKSRSFQSGACSSTAMASAVANPLLESETQAEIVEFLLENGANACDLGTDGEKTVLMHAVKGKNTRVIRALVAHGANIDAQVETSKDTAIFLAIESCQPEICKILLDKGADLSPVGSEGRTIAHAVAKCANTEILTYFLPFIVDWTRSEGARSYNLEVEVLSGIPPLHLACKYGFANFITLLWERKLLDDIEVPWADEIRPLHWGATAGHPPLAARNGHTRCVNILLQRGALVNLKDKTNRTAADLTSVAAISEALKYAALKEASSNLTITTPLPYEEVVTSNMTADPRAPELLKACKYGKFHDCRQLLDLGVHPNGISGDDSPLETALRAGNNDIALLLINRGADIHQQASSKVGRRGFQAIHYAVWADMGEVVSKLLDKGARMSDHSAEPIHIAAYRGLATVMTKLLEYECAHNEGSAQRILQAQIKALDLGSETILAPDIYTEGALVTGTALHVAVSGGQVEAINILLKYGADVDAPDGLGRPPLYHAIVNNHFAAAKIMLDAGANISAQDFAGDSIFVYSVLYALTDTKIMEELVSRGVDTTTVNLMGRGAVHELISFSTCEVKLLERLCELGLSFDLRDNYGATPLQFCLQYVQEESNAEDVAVFLINHDLLLASQPEDEGKNLLNHLCASTMQSTRPLKRILERLRGETSTEVAYSYINNHCKLYGTPLYCASYNGRIDMMEILYQAGANIVSARGPKGSALNVACSMNSVDAIKWLLRHGDGVVSDEAMELALPHKSATRIMTRYKDLGLEGLIEAPVLPNKDIVTVVKGISDVEEVPGSAVFQRRTEFLYSLAQQILNSERRATWI